MLPEQITEIAKVEIARRYPEMRGVEPVVEEKVAPKPILRKPGEAVPESELRKVYVLTFKKDLTAADGAIVRQVLRVTVDEQGRIVKAVVSR
ncbi:MAG: hypothetical protein M1343_14910 [Chloroflexi bacterium]|nr:hypothetical protein [Chloroflexota bacterium]MDA8188312.1 hypothetical protein [Dehalococcoidales bacterium]